MGKLWRLGVVVLMLLAVAPGRASAADGEPTAYQAQQALAEITDALRRPVVSAAGATIDGYGGVTAIGGGHTCAVILFADVWCWGANSDGQLGDGSTEDSAEPVLASPSGDLVNRTVLGVVAGRAHTCALVASDGASSAYCWGANDQGQLGDGSLTSRTRSVEVAGDLAGLAVGDDHTCVIAYEMTVSCWGRNDAGQLGVGTVGPGDPNPQEVPGLTDIVDIAAAENNTCAVNDTGDAWCWGSDSDGQLGDGGGGSGVPAASPVPVTAVPDGFAQISVGRRHVCALTGARPAEGPVYCWGGNASGQLGAGPAGAGQAGSAVDAPVEVDGGVAFVAVSAGGDSSCAIRSGGEEYCWGDNTAGQLSTGDTTARDVPTPVDQRNVLMSPTAAKVAGGNASMVVDISAGLTHACATDPMMTVYCTVPGTGLLTEIPLAPGPARGLRAAAADAALAVTWEPPERTGAAPIDGYIAVALTGSDPPGMAGACEPAGSVRACEIPLLTNGQRYPVLVVSLSAGGLSYSGLVSATPVAAAPAGPGDPADPGEPGDLPLTGPGGLLSLALALIGLGYVLRSPHAFGSAAPRRRRRPGRDLRPDA